MVPHRDIGVQGEAINDGAAAVTLGRVLEAGLVARQGRERGVNERGFIFPVMV